MPCAHRTSTDVLQFFNIPPIRYSIFLSFTSYPMPTVCFIDTESGTDNSITDALQVDDSSCSDVPYNTVIELKHSSNACCSSSFYSGPPLSDILQPCLPLRSQRCLALGDHFCQEESCSLLVDVIKNDKRRWCYCNFWPDANCK